MGRETFEGQVGATWSAHFGAAVADLEVAGTTLVPLERLAGSGDIHLAHIRQRTFAEVDPVLHDVMTALLLRAGPQARLSAAVLRASPLAGRVRTADQGFIFHLDPDRLIGWDPAPPVVLRRLTMADQEALQALFDRCTPQEVDDAYVDCGHEIAWGAFEGRRMIACGSGYRRHGFMDLGVLTDPERRGRRLAPAVVAALSQACPGLGVLAMYRCDRTNTASRRAAEAAGLTRCFHTERLTLAPA